MIRGRDEELAAHKYSHVERERRFLVDAKQCPDLAALPAILIEDRYISGTRFRLRRMSEIASGRVVLKLSKKYDVADVKARPLVTGYLTDAEYALFAALPATPIVKVRHSLAEGGHEFGIDRFDGALAGLLMAEIECVDADTLDSVVMPSWAAREVTADAAFQGGALSVLQEDEVRTLLGQPRSSP
ncbi:MAG TPA: hypothetical protein VF638_13950 [Sphingomonas sp.]